MNYFEILVKLMTNLSMNYKNNDQFDGLPHAFWTS